MAPARRADVRAEAAASGYVDRPRLRAVLELALEHRLTLVVAGPGYGKTTLLARWAAETERARSIASPRASLPAFAGEIARALFDAEPRLGEQVAETVRRSVHGGGDSRTSAEALAAAVGRALDEELLRDDVAVVVDDVHELGRTGPSVRFLDALLRHAPPRFHLVLATRHEPPFRVERLRGRGQVLEVDASELSFTEQEVASILSGLEAEDAAAEVYALTLGWPAAVRLAYEALRGAGGDRARVLADLGGSRGTVFARLAQDVLDEQPAWVCDLLRRVAPLDRFTVEL